MYLNRNKWTVSFTLASKYILTNSCLESKILHLTNVITSHTILWGVATSKKTSLEVLKIKLIFYTIFYISHVSEINILDLLNNSNNLRHILPFATFFVLYYKFPYIDESILKSAFKISGINILVLYIKHVKFSELLHLIHSESWIFCATLCNSTHAHMSQTNLLLSWLKYADIFKSQNLGGSCGCIIYESSSSFITNF